MDLQATSTGDLAIVDGELAFVTGREAIAQAIAFRLRTFLGESRFDRGAGVPWLQLMLRPETTDESRRSIVRQQVLATPGVTGCDVSKVDVHPLTRAATMTGRAVTVDGEIDFAVEASP